MYVAHHHSRPPVHAERQQVVRCSQHRPEPLLSSKPFLSREIYWATLSYGSMDYFPGGICDINYLAFEEMGGFLLCFGSVPSGRGPGATSSFSSA